jgi:hypothetical protein
MHATRIGASFFQKSIRQLVTKNMRCSRSIRLKRKKGGLMSAFYGKDLRGYEHRVIKCWIYNDIIDNVCISSVVASA